MHSNRASIAILLSILSVITGDVKLNFGGYEDIVINFKNNVEYKPTILPNLHEYFINASEVLYNATLYNYQNDNSSLRFFKQASVVLPNSWRGKVPEQFMCKDEYSINRHNADFIIGKETKNWGMLPHTDKTHSHCGRAQENPIYLPETFFTYRDIASLVFGDNLGKPLIHEWAIYRYGLFEESNAKEGGNNCEDIDGVFTPVRCSTEIEGTFWRGNCDFDHDESKSNNAKGSLMFYGPHFLKKIYTFCDMNEDGTSPFGLEHDFTASHLHNRHCGGRTGWEVLRQHPDFIGQEGPDYDQSKNFDKDFTLNCTFHPGYIRIVLVMDASNSMAGERMLRMRQDVARFLDNLWEAGEPVQVGMIEFNEFAYTLVEMTFLNTQDDLKTLKNAIPRDTLLYTCIGCGLQKALEILVDDDGTTMGSNIYVFTDGQESKGIHPTIAMMRDDVLISQVTVYGLLLIDQSDDHDLVKLAQDTGGESCIYSEDEGGNRYYECLNKIHDIHSENLPVEIKSQDYSIVAESNETDVVSVDSSFNERMRFTLTWTSSYISYHNVLANCNDLDLQILSPDGRVIGVGDAGYEKDNDFHFIYIYAQDNQPGMWTYNIINPSANTCGSRLTVEGFHSTNTSHPENDMNQPLEMETFTSTTELEFKEDADPFDNSVRLLVTLKKGNAPIINADVEAQIENETPDKWNIRLLDNGAGADIEKNDGIYAGFFFQYTTDGIYSIRFSAKGLNKTTAVKLEDRVLVEDAGHVSIRKTTRFIAYEDFERSSAGGFFDVSGVPSNPDAAFPPSKIVDIEIVGQATNVSVELQWTAVGESLDQGRASNYDLRLSQNIQQLLWNFSSCIRVSDSALMDGTLESPLPAGHVENININPQYILLNETIELNVTYFIAIRAVDSYDNAGDISNVAVVHFVIEKSTTLGPTAMPSTPVPTNAPVQSTLWIVVSGTMAGTVLAVAVIGGIVAKNKKKVHIAPNDTFDMT